MLKVWALRAGIILLVLLVTAAVGVIVDRAADNYHPGICSCCAYIECEGCFCTHDKKQRGVCFGCNTEAGCDMLCPCPTMWDKHGSSP